MFNNIGPLETLNLSYNEFSDVLHASIGNLRNVHTLYLQHNQIGGCIPNELCRLKKLRYLDISTNQLRGQLPVDIGQLESIEKLLLLGNNLIGPVPKSIGNLIQTLRDFYVFRPFPSQLSKPIRGYQKHYFERVFIFGPAVGIDNITWEPTASTSADDLENF